ASSQCYDCRPFGHSETGLRCDATCQPLFDGSQYDFTLVGRGDMLGPYVDTDGTSYFISMCNANHPFGPCVQANQQPMETFACSVSDSNRVTSTGRYTSYESLPDSLADLDLTQET
ncbi:hypothetical protein KIPB_012565, partial [Kipferlia bialata]